MTVQDFLKETMAAPNQYGVHPVRPWVKCMDGFEVSIQAGNYLYCRPRINNADSYAEVELGFPNQEESLLMDYAEDPDKPTDTVYGYVPIDLAEEVIQKHGGIDETYMRYKIYEFFGFRNNSNPCYGRTGV